MEALRAAAARADTLAVIALCEQIELDESLSPNCVADVEVYAAYLAALLAHPQQDEFSMKAKFLWKRIPIALREASGELQALHAVLVQSWRQSIACPKLAHFEWSTSVQPLILAAHSELRKWAWTKLATASQRVSVDDACSLTELSREFILEYASASGWLVAGDILTRPASPSLPSTSDTIGLQAITAAAIQLSL
eukprot:m.259523 g.259523  ORF g.259523 m.259523 type:complete len:195 (-) comp54585_c0_seq20:122-706(-)